MRAIDLRLYFVVDVRDDNVDYLALVDAAVRGGVTLVQLRAKSVSDSALITLARRMQELLARYDIPLIINDRVDVAKAVKAAGVHLGKHDTNVGDARACLGDRVIIGYSVETISDLDVATAGLVDYVAVSPVFATNTKLDTVHPLGLEGVRIVAAKSILPVVGIGGINRENASFVIEAGAAGVAVVSAITTAAMPQVAASTLKLSIDAALATRFKPQEYRRVLTIAGSDSGGGAGIQADLKTFQALRCYGMSAITAVTAQNTHSVTAVEPLTPALVEAQLHAVFSDIGVDAVKIGMLHSAPIIRAVARMLKEYKVKDVVLDPVMIAKSGDALLDKAAIVTLRDELFPLAAIVTPNIPEVEALTGITVRSEAEMAAAAQSMQRQVPRVLVKGGHAEFTAVCTDCYLEGSAPQWLRQSRIATHNTHGTGCTYAAAITAYRALGLPWSQSVRLANRYLHNAILFGARQRLGRGAGPVDHSWQLSELSL